MPSFFLNALIRTPFLGTIKLALAERDVFKSFTFYTTSNPEELDELFKIRYKVYCEEYRYLDASKFINKRETDEYDKHSLHLVVRHKSGDLAATARLIIGSESGLPILKNFNIEYSVPDSHDDKIAEVSRLIVGRQYRRKRLLMVLIKGLYLLVKEKRITNVFCVLDDRLTPNLIDFGIPIKKIGKSQIFQGVTAPYLIHVNELEEIMHDRNRSLLKFLTNGSMEPKGKDYKYTLH